MSDNVRSLPRQVSSQAAVLGCLLIDPSLCGEIFARVQAEDFVTPEYRHVYEAARRLFFSGRAVDAVTICHEAGGDMYRKLLMDIMDVTPTAAGWLEYVEILLADVRLYRLHLAGDRLANCTTEEEAQTVLSQIRLDARSDQRMRKVPIKQGLVTFHERQSQKPEYLSYGIGGLDQRMNTEPGDFIVIGGRPSAGKTAFALQLAKHMSEKRRVGFFSLETSPEKLYDRLVAQSCLVDFGQIKHRKIAEDDYGRIIARQVELGKLNLDVWESPGASVEDICSTTLAERYDIIFVDYLQLLRETGKNANRTEAVSRMSIGLHRFAQDQKVIVIALVQLGRPEKEAKGQKAPRMESVKESGQIEQDADALILLYLTEPDNPRSDRRVKIAKNKDGDLGSFDMDFEGRFQHFVEYMPEDKPAPVKIPRYKPDKPEQMKLGGNAV